MTMHQEEVLTAVLASKELPTLPIVASKLITLTSQEDTTLTDIADLVSKDMALSSKILKISNSSFYSFPQQISSINQAVSILGTNAVRSLVLSFSFLSMKTAGRSFFNFEKFWEQSLAGAVAAKLVLEQVPGMNTEEIFISGLLQNIGQLIFASTLPDLYEQVLEQRKNRDDRPQEELEQDIIGSDHALVGFAVAQHWGFPEALLLPIKFHHHPEEYREDNPQMQASIKAVHLAHLLVEVLYSDNPQNYHKQFHQKARELLGLKTFTVNNILKQIHKQVDMTASYFGLDMEPVKSVEEILQEANLRLSLLNLSYEEMNRELIRSKMELEKAKQELEHKNRLLENLANIDGLTEVHNHRYFQEFLDKEINRCIRNERTVSLLLMDIDHFKRFNDTYGHQTGDFILKELCRLISERIREYDLLARYGGEEFILILPETEPNDAKTVAEKIRTAVENHDFHDGNRTYHVTVSIGVASARPQSIEFNKQEFIGLADQALYQAKRGGRNQVAMYQPEKKKKWFHF